MRALALILLVAGCDRLLGLTAVTPVSDARDGGGGDGGGKSDALDSGLTPCLVDDFSTMTIDTSKWTEFSTAGSPVPQVMLNSGVVEVDIPMGSPASPPYNGLQSVNAYPFDDATFEVRVAMLPSDQNAGIRLYALIDAGNQYYATLAGGSVSLTDVHSGGQQTAGGIPIDPASVHFMRLRTSGGMIYVETSAVVGVWVTQYQEPVSVPTTMMAVGFAVGIEPKGTTASDQVAQFDDAIVRCQ